MIYANYRALMNKLKHSGLLGFVIILLSAYSSNAQVICNAPPENDFCRDAFEIDGTLLGNTCCGEIEGFNICEMDVGLELESGVWYYYDQTLSATLLEIENLNIEGGIGVEVYAGSCGSLTLLAKSDCTGFEDRDFIVPNCNGYMYCNQRGFLQNNFHCVTVKTYSFPCLWFKLIIYKMSNTNTPLPFIFHHLYLIPHVQNKSF